MFFTETVGATTLIQFRQDMADAGPGNCLIFWHIMLSKHLTWAFVQWSVGVLMHWHKERADKCKFTHQRIHCPWPKHIKIYEVYSEQNEEGNKIIIWAETKRQKRATWPVVNHRFVVVYVRLYRTVGGTRSRNSGLGRCSLHFQREQTDSLTYCHSFCV